MIGVSFTIDTGRALMAAMQPITGYRARGQIRMRAKPGTTVSIPRNSYWMPVVDGQRQTSWLFKVGQGPNADKSWTVDDSGNSVINVFSNIGGARHNVDADTQFQPDLPIDALELVGADAPKAVADFTGGENPNPYCGALDMALYETFDGPDLTVDVHRSPIDAFPGVLLAFQNLEPADGVAIASNNQGAVNAGEGKKFYKVTYSISVITVRGEGDAARRMEGLIIADAICQLLNDKKAGDPGECLSNPGGVQVRQMSREDGPQPIYKKFYIYTILVSATILLQRPDYRTFNPWLRAVMNVDVPQSPELPNQGAYELVNDVSIDMTPGQRDIAIDGIFSRLGGGNLWAPATIEDTPDLLAFVLDERRATYPAFGVLLEPAVTNDVGAAAEDLTLWTPAGVSVPTVAVGVEANPLGVAAAADRVDFGASDDSSLDLAGVVAGVAGEPVILQVFAKAPGTKFTSLIRLAAVDSSATVHMSEDLEIGPTWGLYRFEIVPVASGSVTLRLQNASDGQARQAIVWGVQYSEGARWGAEYVDVALTAKAKDVLRFDPYPTTGADDGSTTTPQSCLTGRWALRFRTPTDVTPDVLGTATGAPVRVLASIGDGATELVTLNLIGTPASGGAALTLATRGAGPEISLAGLEWVPGAELRFVIDALGTLTVEGTLNGDGEYSFARYDGDATSADYLVLGDLSTGTASPTPGYYVAVEHDL